MQMGFVFVLKMF